MKLFSKYSNCCDCDISTLLTIVQIDVRTTCRGNTALCVALHGKKLYYNYKHGTKSGPAMAGLAGLPIMASTPGFQPMQRTQYKALVYVLRKILCKQRKCIMPASDWWHVSFSETPHTHPLPVSLHSLSSSATSVPTVCWSTGWHRYYMPRHVLRSNNLCELLSFWKLSLYDKKLRTQILYKLPYKLP